MIITKEFDFDAAHYLPNVPDGHKCKRLHGHTYRVVLEIASSRPLDPVTAWVMDYAGIQKVWSELEDYIDHRYLNDVPGLDNPTTEVVALWILMKLGAELPALAAVTVHESRTTLCRVDRKDLSHNMHRFQMPGLMSLHAPAPNPKPADSK